MANPIHQIIQLIATILMSTMALTVFGPFINDTLRSLVYDALAAPTGSLATNSAALKLTVDMLIMGFDAFLWFVMAVALFKVFFYIGFKTEEVNYG